MKEKRMIEPELEGDFDLWQSNPGPETLTPLLKRLDPVIDTAVHTYGMGSGGPLVRGRAKRILIESLPRYDPKASKLATFAYSQLQGLRRAVTQQNSPLHIPERVLLDQNQLYEAEGRLADELGREPSDTELADHTGLSVKRIRHIRTFRPGAAEGQIQGVGEAGNLERIDPAVIIPERDKMDSWTEFVYYSLQPTDRVIMERTLGLHGKSQLSNQQIAKVLRISPAAVSQRKFKIQSMINKRSEIGI